MGLIPGGGTKIPPVCVQSCLTLCDPMDCSLTPLSVGFSQKELEWVAVSFSRESSQLRDQTYVSCIGRQISYDRAIWEASKILGPHDTAK